MTARRRRLVRGRIDGGGRLGANKCVLPRAANAENLMEGSSVVEGRRGER